MSASLIISEIIKHSKMFYIQEKFDQSISRLSEIPGNLDNNIDADISKISYKESQIFNDQSGISINTINLNSLKNQNQNNNPNGIILTDEKLYLDTMGLAQSQWDNKLNASSDQNLSKLMQNIEDSSKLGILDDKIENIIQNSPGEMPSEYQTNEKDKKNLEQFKLLEINDIVSTKSNKISNKMENYNSNNKNLRDPISSQLYYQINYNSHPMGNVGDIGGMEYINDNGDSMVIDEIETPKQKIESLQAYEDIHDINIPISDDIFQTEIFDSNKNQENLKAEAEKVRIFEHSRKVSKISQNEGATSKHDIISNNNLQEDVENQDNYIENNIEAIQEEELNVINEVNNEANTNNEEVKFDRNKISDNELVKNILTNKVTANNRVEPHYNK